MNEEVRERRRQVLDLQQTAQRIREHVEGSERKRIPRDKSLNQVIDELHAIGRTPEECVENLVKAKEWGEITDMSILVGGDPRYTWGFRFCAGGCGFKAAGWKVPGGYVCTWWK
jgi:hypothetical protein